MSTKIIITCEHAGNTIPPEYAHLFSGEEEVLYSHKAIDFGALRLAKSVALEAGAPLFYTTISRILVEANRSPDEEELFSEFSKNESDRVKKDLLDRFYWPHRKKVEDKISGLINEGNRVIHIGVHTFAPVFEGEVRQVEVGILLDPARLQELDLGKKLQGEIRRVNPNLNVQINSPYPGTNDCFQSFLRERYPEDQYLGFEIEVNQKFFLTGEEGIWETLERELTEALRTVGSEVVISNT